MKKDMDNETLDLAIKGILAGKFVYSSSWNDITTTRCGYVSEIGTGVMVMEIVAHYEIMGNSEGLTWAIAAHDRIEAARKAREAILLNERKQL